MRNIIEKCGRNPALFGYHYLMAIAGIVGGVVSLIILPFGYICSIQLPLASYLTGRYFDKQIRKEKKK